MRNGRDERNGKGSDGTGRHHSSLGSFRHSRSSYIRPVLKHHFTIPALPHPVHSCHRHPTGRLRRGDTGGERGEGGVNRKVNGVGGRLFPLVIKSLSKSRGSYRFGSSRLTVASSPHLIRSYPHVSSPGSFGSRLARAPFTYPSPTVHRRSRPLRGEVNGRGKGGGTGTGVTM